MTKKKDVERILYAKKNIVKDKLKKSPDSKKLKKEYRVLDKAVRKLENGK